MHFTRLNIVRDRKHGRRSAFTLIELLVVILIILILAGILITVLLAAFGKGKEETSKVMLEKVGSASQSAQAQTDAVPYLMQPKKLVKFVKPGFAGATGIANADSWEKLNPKQRSKLLAFLIAPTQDQWDKINADSKMKRLAVIDEKQIADMVKADDDGFNMLVDGWGNPIDYLFFEKAGAAASGLPPFVVTSAGDDGDLTKADDNLNWSSAKKDYKGKVDG